MKNPMDPLYEVHALAGETLALQAVLFGILPRLAAVSPEIKVALSAGFDDAANLVEQIALKFVDQIHPAHAARALKIVEGIRSNTLCEPQKLGNIT
jgi:hypothetical protein